MVDSPEATHNEVRSICRVVQFFSVLWLLGIVAGIVIALVAAK